MTKKSYATKKKRMDGTPWEKSVKTGIWGELIAVKQDSLLLLGAGRKDVSIDIADIKAIGIVKKSQASLGAVLGFVVGASIGQLTYEDTYEENFLGSSFTAVSVGMLGGLIGLVIGAAVGMDKTIQIEGMTDSRIQETLDYLRKKARIRDYK